MDKNFTDNELFETFHADEINYIKSSRAKNAHKARRKVKSYLERKRFRRNHEDFVDYQWDVN
jgi:hypothetical protein